ncbi:MAG: lysophospholipid acyltransferase family protein [Endomicrobium sp.]|jgi:predicted LPLAT superfamily acyltransferase|nr:lysophospholipid acyltransferase family protein [Endomicrobium sp.]
MQQWTGESRGNKFFQKLLAFFVKYGGRQIAYAISYGVVFVYTLMPSVRKSASFYIKRRFGGHFFSLFFHIYKLNLSFAKILIDRAVFGIRGDVTVISSKEDQDLCRRLLSKNKGLIIITAHCGCWQMAMSAFDFMEGDKYVVYYRTNKDVDKHVHELSGGSSPVHFIDSAGFAGASIEIMAALQNKGIVCIMGDRTFGALSNCVEVDFLGGKINVPASIYRIAGALGVPVAIIFFPHVSGGRIDSVIASSFSVEDKGAKPENYAKEAAVFAGCLEAFAKKYPYQFFNYYNMWSK